MNSEALPLTSMQRSGEILFRLRDYTPIPIGLVAILFAEPTLTSIFLGLFIALLGESVRAYGVAFIGTISRTRSYSNGKLVTSGPFSVLRNPLYFGNLLLSVGLATMSAIPWVVIMVIAFFYFQYIPIVAWEEMKLTRIFGQEYTQYCSEVPNRWFPKLRAFWQYDWCVRPDSWGPTLRSEKRTLTAQGIVVLLMAALFLLNQAAETPVVPLANFLTFGK